MSGTHTVFAICATRGCRSKYTDNTTNDNTKRLRALLSNRHIWMQTHDNLTGHARFVTGETITSMTIVSRTEDDPQGILRDDENYTLDHIGGEP